MNEKNKQRLNSSIMILNLLGIKNEEIIVTGSLALDLCGMLPSSHEVHDFDCLVTVPKENISSICDKINLLCALSNGTINNIDLYEDSDNNCIYFNVFGYEINIWFINKKDVNTELKWNDVFVQKPKQILRQKLGYGRTKDYKDAIDMVKLMLG